MSNISLFESFTPSRTPGFGLVESIRRKRPFSAGGVPLVNAFSLDYDGVNDFVLVPDAPNLRPATNMSISFWFKLDTFWSNTINGLVSKGVSAGSEDWSIHTTSSNRIVFQTDTGVGIATSQPATGTFNVDTWHHVVWVYDGGLSAVDRVKLYVDGVITALFIQNTHPTSLQQGTGGLAIAAISAAGSFTFGPGNMDEVAFFNSSLNQAGVNVLRNGNVPADLTGLPGLVSWWRMGDGDTFPIITDNAGSNDGTMQNMVIGDIVADTA